MWPRAFGHVMSLGFAAVLLASGIAAQPQEPDAGWNSFFGNLHAHTGVSDGVERPAKAFEWARKEAKLDFLCLSEHNHLSQQTGLDETHKAALAATSDSFVGLVGQEFSVISKGNHVNVYDVSLQIPAAMNSNYRGLFGQWLRHYHTANPTRIVFGQFNHAESVNKDYGIVSAGDFPNYDGDWEAFVAEVDPWVSLIAVISGPADSNWPKKQTPLRDQHRDMDSKLVRIWQTYLDRGMHLSPVADQDNHRISWGTRTKARTGVWVNGPLTREALLMSLKDGRAFASEDPHLRVWFSINGQPMGSRLADPGESDLSILVRITDQEEPNARYVATLFHEAPGDGELPLSVEESDQLKNGEAWRVTREHLAGVNEAFLIHVRQVETAGPHVDDAWAAPIWIETNGGVTSQPDEPTDEGFVRSKNSKIYHFKNCAIAKQIEENGNLIPHTPKQGDGTRLHKNCPTSHD